VKKRGETGNEKQKGNKIGDDYTLSWLSCDLNTNIRKYHICHTLLLCNYIIRQLYHA
jgi:hypothetical protein